MTKHDDLKQGMDIGGEELKTAGAGRMFKWVVVGFAALAVLALVGGVFSTLTKVATAPGRVLDRALETGNIIHNYEWFHDTHAAYLSRRNQIASYKKVATDSQALLELQAMRQSCRDLVTKYNANSTKTNRSIFKGRDAPSELDLNTCEG